MSSQEEERGERWAVAFTADRCEKWLALREPTCGKIRLTPGRECGASDRARASVIVRLPTPDWFGLNQHLWDRVAYETRRFCQPARGRVWKLDDTCCTLMVMHCCTPSICVQICISTGVCCHLANTLRTAFGEAHQMLWGLTPPFPILLLVSPCESPQRTDRWAFSHRKPCGGTTPGLEWDEAHAASASSPTHILLNFCSM